VVERAIWPEEMESFEQAFLTGTAAEVTAIQSIGPYKFGSVEIARQLDRDYEDLVNGRILNS
jgi:branched-chain amino acid aminotransferase